MVTPPFRTWGLLLPLAAMAVFMAVPAVSDAQPEEPLTLLKRALRLKAEGRIAEAVPLWVRLSEYPETRMTAREHLKRATPADLKTAADVVRRAYALHAESRLAEPQQIVLPIPGLPISMVSLPLAQGQPPPAELDAMGERLKRAMQLESEGRYDEALALWTELANQPDLAGVARQRRNILLLRAPAGQAAPTLLNIDAARQLIGGAGAADDPMLFNEHLALASAVAIAAGQESDATRRTELYGQARSEFRRLLEGVSGRQAPDDVRRIAEWNLAVLASRDWMNADPAYWERGLREFPPGPGRERVRLFMALRQAEASFRANQPQGVRSALELANRIAGGMEGAGSLAVQDAEAVLRGFRRTLVARAAQQNQLEQYRPILGADLGAEFAAAEASESYRRFVQALAQRPEAFGEAPGTFQQVLERLQSARGQAPEGSPLRQQLDQDIQAVERFLQVLTQTPPALLLSWNRAAERTNAARSAEEWEAAATAWREVYGTTAEGSPERAEAGRHLFNAQMRRGEVLFRAGNRDAAQQALEQARATLGEVGQPWPEADRTAATDRLQNNLLALQPPREELVPPTGNVPAYAGGRIGPCRAPCMIMHYHEYHQPDVEDWLNRLQQNQDDALTKLVDWFNNSPMRQGDPTVRRDWTPETLIEFLSRTMNRTPGTQRAGARQWCDHDRRLGRGWHGYAVKSNGAAYYLNNGVALINAECSNPLDVIRVREIPPPALVETPEAAIPRPLPQVPPVVYARPQPEFAFFVEGIFQPYALPLPQIIIQERGRQSPEPGRQSPEPRGRQSPERRSKGTRGDRAVPARAAASRAPSVPVTTAPDAPPIPVR